jgi:hypothetical protein
MDETRKKKDGGRGVTILAAVLMFVLPILYVLSSGPTLVLVKRGQWDGGAWKQLYRPVIYVSHKSSGCYQVWQWYLAEWTERPPEW